MITEILMGISTALVQETEFSTTDLTQLLTNSSSNSLDTVFRNYVDKFLSDTEELPLKHQGVILAASLATGLNRWGKPNFGAVGNAIIDCIVDPTRIMDYIADGVYRVTNTSGNNPTQWLRDAIAMRDQINASPNIEGIPIQADSESCTRSVNIAEQQVMVTSGTRKTVSDNAVPLPRKWSIHGYITSVSRIDEMYYHKPTVGYQLLFLDEASCSHKPVWYKSYDGRYYLTQITEFQSSRKPEATNAAEVSIELTEYNPLIIESSLIPLSASVGDYVLDE